MKKIFFFIAFVAMSMLSIAQNNQLVWLNGRLLYGTPIESIDSLTYDKIQDVDTLHLLLPHTLEKEVHDTVTIVKYDTIETVVYDTVYITKYTCLPEGALPGKFSVSPTKKVYFSKGNLQYKASTNTWRFAEKQWDYVGDSIEGTIYEDGVKSDNALISSSYNGWIDLFGWSGSTGATLGISTSINNNDYSGEFVDWGNKITDNGQLNTWYTLTAEEWNYIIFQRPNASLLCTVAEVNGINSLILLPDNWVCPSGIILKSGLSSDDDIDAYGVYQAFDAKQWSKLEYSGAVLLPIAGRRYGSAIDYVQYYGRYWSATKSDENNAFFLRIYSNLIDLHTNGRYGGHNIRLVHDVE